jgi:hypothetical protein
MQNRLWYKSLSITCKSVLIETTSNRLFSIWVLHSIIKTDYLMWARVSQSRSSKTIGLLKASSSNCGPLMIVDSWMRSLQGLLSIFMSPSWLSFIIIGNVFPVESIKCEMVSLININYNRYYFKKFWQELFNFLFQIFTMSKRSTLYSILK